MRRSANPSSVARGDSSLHGREPWGLSQKQVYIIYSRLHHKPPGSLPWRELSPRATEEGFAERLSENPDILHTLCCEGYEVEPPECLEIIGILEEQGFYELIYILLIKNRYHAVIGGAIERLLAEMWMSEWEKAGNQQMCKELKERIQKEMAFREPALA